MDAEIAGNVEPPSGMCCEPVCSRAHSMVSVSKRYQIVATSVHTCHHHGQIIGFRPAVDKIYNLEGKLMSSSSYQNSHAKFLF